MEDDRFPALGAVDPYGETLWRSSLMPASLADLEAALPVADDGAEKRGLLWLQVLAERCRDSDGPNACPLSATEPHGG